MNFKMSKKPQAIYRSIYLKETLSDKIDKLANKYDISFNKAIISMIEYCLEQWEK